MKTAETVRTALGFADQGVRVLESMKDAPLVHPGPFGGNHAMWILGHVTIAEGRLLDEIGDEGLDQPTKVAPPGLEAAFATVGKAVMSIAMHQIFHNGEAAAARRASGQQPVFVPSKELRAF